MQIPVFYEVHSKSTNSREEAKQLLWH